MLEAGTAKRTITAHRMGIGMMGYGMHFNFVHGVETELYARAFVLTDPAAGRTLALVNCELCFISASIKRGVVERLERDHPELGLDDSTVMLCAQHTHSGPGGYSHHAFYNFTIPGFVPEVLETIVAGVVEAIVAAHARRAPTTLRRAAGSFAPEIEVAFNRSLPAYNANEDVTPVPPSEANLAVDRTMELLRFDDRDGRPIGAISWFGVHATSLSNDNHDINADNKGYAAIDLEARMQQAGAPEFVGAFAQACAGDVSPNYIYDRKKRWTRGKFEDDLESARWHGHAQADKAAELLEAAASARPIAPTLDAALVYVDMSDVACDPEFTGGEADARTSPACIGVEMLAGTREGPGMPKPIALAARMAAGTVRAFELARSVFLSPSRRRAIRQKYRSQGRKHIVIEMGERRILGVRNVGALPVPGVIDPTLATFKRHYRSGGLADNPWTPQVLPLQIFVIGELAIVAVPGELTTVAGRRLRETVRAELAARGVTTVLLTTYANAYTGYVCTREEYQHQRYEGSHTVFGQWTLAAFQTEFRRLARALAANERPTSAARPASFSERELSLRLHDGPFRTNARAAARLSQERAASGT